MCFLFCQKNVLCNRLGPGCHTRKRDTCSTHHPHCHHRWGGGSECAACHPCGDVVQDCAATQRLQLGSLRPLFLVSQTDDHNSAQAQGTFFHTLFLLRLNWPVQQMRWPSGPNANGTWPHLGLLLHIRDHSLTHVTFWEKHVIEDGQNRLTKV